MPLHLKRKRKRGFNQVDIIGRATSEALHIPYFSEVLIRTKTPRLYPNRKEKEVVFYRKLLPLDNLFQPKDTIY